MQHSNEMGVFSYTHLRALFPGLSDGAFRGLMSRLVAKCFLKRVCNGIYFFKPGFTHNGLLLYHVASLLRSNHFNYLSLETVLSDHGVISQVPLQWISLMSSGRSNIIDCGEFGTIEFIHTTQPPSKLVDALIYDQRLGLWRANIDLAMRDMKRTLRNMDLIDYDILDQMGGSKR
jgi:hypothetical protein